MSTDVQNSETGRDVGTRATETNVAMHVELKLAFLGKYLPPFRSCC